MPIPIGLKERYTQLIEAGADPNVVNRVIQQRYGDAGVKAVEPKGFLGNLWEAVTAVPLAPPLTIE